jgi:hypothetical protein
MTIADEPANRIRVPRVGAPMRHLTAWLCSIVLWSAPLSSHASELPGPSPYPLDDVGRTLAPGEKLPCEAGTLELISYRGELLRYQKPLRIHPAFAAQLRELERIVVDVAQAHYGRAPTRIVHLGSYACRRMRRYPDWVSEHALGNAIDVAGFDFAPLPRGAKAPDALPKALRRAFEVRLEKHWSATGTGAVHAAFLRDLATRLIERPDVFPVVLGPAWPGHHNHFHLDHAPYRVVEVF